ncbi:MAG: hypothetical protein NZ551_01460 [Microscillaceae bacterium]|nr:hypothetical protein [Microscillaceae bacterium]MDW8459856.1 adenylate/guanylate cyclase domain-containing protein [Cytophagales bacterium]
MSFFRIELGLLAITTWLFNVSIFFNTHAQTATVQSLKDNLEKTAPDTPEQVNILNQLSKSLIKTDKKNSQEYAQKALKIATSLNYETGMADAYANLGNWEGLIQQNAVKAYEYHEKAYQIYKKLYEQNKIDKWKMYEFISENAVPTYKFVTEKEGRKTRKDRKAIQNYEKLNAEMTLYLTSIAADTREELNKASEVISEKSTALSEIASALSETASKLSETNMKLKEKKMSERALILEKIRLSGNLQEKEKQALALSDSLLNQQLILQERELKLQKQALKLSQEQAKAERLAQEKALHEEQAQKQRILIISLIVIGILAISFLVVVFLNLRKQKALNQKLNEQNVQINQQKEEIEAQRDSLAEANISLQQQKEEIEAQRDKLEELYRELELERSKADRLLYNILPREVAAELKETGKATPRYYEMVTVMFTDFKGFTYHAERMRPEIIIQELNECFLKFDEIIEKYGLEKIKTIGDAYMCAGGIPIPNTTNPIDAVNAALEMQKVMQEINKRKRQNNEPTWELRLGIHTGPLVAGVIGKMKFAYDVWGDTVNIASRMESSGEVGKVNISGATYQYVKDEFECEYRGKILAKNKGEIDMYFVVGRKTT